VHNAHRHAITSLAQELERVNTRGVKFILQYSPQHPASSEHSDLYDFLAHIETLGGCGDAHVFQRAHDKYGSMSFGELVNCILEDRSRFFR